MPAEQAKNPSKLSKLKFFKKPRFWFFLAIILPVLSVLTWYVSVVYLLTPENIRDPKVEHLHFRLQIIVNNQPVDFSESRFQETYDKGSCTAILPETPIHAHDNKDQLIHIHWKKITGSQVLKYYGLETQPNFLSKNSMGYTLKDGFWPKELKIQTQALGENFPKEFKEKNYEIFVYEGDQNGYSKRDSKDFLEKDLESFFNKKSFIGSSPKLDFKSFFKGVSAFADDDTDHTGHTEDELKDINNLLGNVVIFMATEEPSAEMVKEKFNNLVPLEKSVCGG